MVYLSPNPGPDSIFTAIIPSQGRKNGPERLLRMGLPVTLNEGYILAHRQTNMYITLDSATPSQTEFGVELECSADRSVAFGKLGLVVSEAQVSICRFWLGLDYISLHMTDKLYILY